MLVYVVCPDDCQLKSCFHIGLLFWPTFHTGTVFFWSIDMTSVYWFPSVSYHALLQCFLNPLCSYLFKKVTGDENLLTIWKLWTTETFWPSCWWQVGKITHLISSSLLSIYKTERTFFLQAFGNCTANTTLLRMQVWSQPQFLNRVTFYR